MSQDRIEGLEDQLRLYVDAVTQVLDANRGSWGQGAFYTGGYEVNFEPVQQGGQGRAANRQGELRSGFFGIRRGMGGFFYGMLCIVQ